MTDKLVLLPAVDVADGKAVRLVQGEAGTETDYGSPIDAAHDFEARGAEWIHLVDLDAAFGRGSNSDLLNQVVKAVDIKVELSGGIRDTESLERALDTGAERVNIGTAALEHPEWTAEMIARFGDQVAIGLDVRGQTLSARGWTKDGGDLYEVLAALESAARALRRHRRPQGRHPAGPERRPARVPDDPHGQADHRLRRRLEPR